MNTLRTYRAIELVTFFIEKGVTPLKLQKLLYYAQVWHFVRYGRKVFSDDIKAWIYGPVIREVWDRYRIMRKSDPIPDKPYFKPSTSSLDVAVIRHLEDVWSSYGHLSGADLVDLTHSEKPWKTSRDGLLFDEPSNKTIPIDADTTSDFKLDSHGQIPKAPQLRSLGFYQS